MGLPVASVPSIHQCTSTAAEPMTCADATAFASIVGTSATFPAAAESLLQQQQSPMPLSFQGSGSMYEEMGALGDQRQNFIYQYGFEGSSVYSSF
ncbi:hypothetical protein Nepgr_002952 [Nepenthes gracilis]|uniref:Uncharacterized protein n=1 Tax=Nepenthes gracilis TaxID=150966 RepID=A0AAD3RYM3_NEPGR|nr:hypothetical protein Nepgr_002952 [Nepenthes gracilis]